MALMPETRYVRTADDLHIAYQVVGDGPDMVVVPTWFSHVEAYWEFPLYANWLERMASFTRLILFDQPGSGLSDPVPLSELPTLEKWVDNIRVVLDAVGSEKAALFAYDAAGISACVFAATHPGRTTALLLGNSYVRLMSDADFPYGFPRDQEEVILTSVADHWGSGSNLRVFAPSFAHDEELRRAWGRWQRQAVSPAAAKAMHRMIMHTDVRHVLPAIHVPTMVFHSDRDAYIPIGQGRYIAQHIEGARFLELRCDDHLPGPDIAAYTLGEVEEFLTGVRTEPQEDRVLVTVLYTDIVSSTESLVALGDENWKAVLDNHDATVRRLVNRFRGRVVKSTGDGILATFDGPARAIRCIQSVRETAQRFGLEVRASLHSGECELRNGDISGIAVHIGARILGEAGPSDILVSRTVVDLVAGSGIEFEDRGEHELKGVPGTWRLFAIRG